MILEIIPGTSTEERDEISGATFSPFRSRARLTSTCLLRLSLYGSPPEPDGTFEIFDEETSRKVEEEQRKAMDDAAEAIGRREVHRKQSTRTQHDTEHLQTTHRGVLSSIPSLSQ